MVDVSTSVELQSGLQGDSGLDGFRGGFLGLKLAEGFLRGVKTVDVCLVVLGVVQGHDLLGDAGFQRLMGLIVSCGIIEIGEADSHRKHTATREECAELGRLPTWKRRQLGLRS